MKRSLYRFSFAVCVVLWAAYAPGDDQPQSASAPARDLRWSFDGDTNDARLSLTGEGDPALKWEIRGKVDLGVAGPRPSEFPDFAPTNTAIRIPAGRNFLAIKDPGDNSVLDFQNGDAITLECWVRWEESLRGSYPYLIGKGRTHSGPGTNFNHNYALRLANNSQGVFPSFLFADAESAAKPKPDDTAWHRWTATEGIPEDGAWHHVAVTYQFGTPESITGYIDGRAVKGVWDAGGPTTVAPVVDNDELWVGSSMAGSSTFTGDIDEVAIHRTALSAEQIKKKVNIQIDASGYAIGKVDPTSVPADHVRVELMEGVPVARSWKFRVRALEPIYETSRFALKDLPRKYNARGLIIDRQVPTLLHLCTRMTLPAGEYEFLVRSLDSARLYIDGELLTETPFMNLNSSAHGPYYELEDPGPDLLSVPAAHSERRVTIKLAEGEHVISLYRLLGNKSRGDYLGELCVGYGPPGGPYKFLAPQEELPFTDDGWLTFLDRHEAELRDWEQRDRLAKSVSEREYWEKRHAYAREHAPAEVPVPSVADLDAPGRTGSEPSAIDRFILARLKQAGIAPMPLTDDFSFLRRLTLDTTGVVPTPEQISAFFADPPESRRRLAIDRLLEDRGWADHWVGYWQDVLAENPGLTKPELNNTGPFRWYLYEAFLDNRPVDQFVTDLVMMEGSTWQGGPAGFAVASQNDVPMAAKAHVLGKAFLGLEMQCARCHDAPYHDIKQEDLFNLAAMLKRSPEKVPGTSSIPATPEQLARMHVKVTLLPGSTVKPTWPFAELVSTDAQTPPVPAALLRNPQDTREQLASQITSPANTRFAKVMVNRLWTRYLGRGLVPVVDDWEGAEPSHPELLDWLARELVTHNYDLKYIARLIFNSDAYQRIPASNDAAELFAGPTRRKLTGEQLVDSLHVIAAKDFGSEELTMDRDGKQGASAFLRLRYPRRSWQLLAVSNERDRPSLNLPVAQTLVDLLGAYGWRQQRQDPLTVREEVLTPLTPMALAHGTASSRALDLSDRAALTELALQPQPVDQFVEQLYLRLLTRPPTTEERETLLQFLSPGYDARIVAGPEAVPPRRIFRSGVTWANHFAPKSDEEAIARQREVLRGDAPTARLDPEWRSRAEDAAWALVNLPEFLFVP